MGKATSFIAVVDDEPPVRTMLRRVLRLADYPVQVWASGEEFLASISTALPACVVLDVHLPELDGFEVLARLRAVKVVIPVILMTASDDAEFDKRAVAAGAFRLLRKPFSSDELIEAIALALATP